MNTTELFVEQVLIGLLVVVAGGLLLTPGGVPAVDGLGWGSVPVLVAAVYLAGILYDRVADTILERINTHHRLWFAIGELAEGRGVGDDPFPEDLYRIRLLDSDQAARHHDYLRSRMRITRALCTLLPALGLGVVFAANADSLEPAVRYAGAAFVAVAYGAAFTLGAARGRELPQGDDDDGGGSAGPDRRDRQDAADRRRANPDGPADGSRRRVLVKLPRTDELKKDRDVLRRYRRHAGIGEHETAPAAGALAFIMRMPAARILLWFTAAASGLALSVEPAWAIVPWAAFLLTWVTGWSWWRITETFFRFVRDWFRFAPVKDAAAHGASTEGGSTQGASAGERSGRRSAPGGDGATQPAGGDPATGQSGAPPRR